MSTLEIILSVSAVVSTVMWIWEFRETRDWMWIALQWRNVAKEWEKQAGANLEAAKAAHDDFLELQKSRNP